MYKIESKEKYLKLQEEFIGLPFKHQKAFYKLARNMYGDEDTPSEDLLPYAVGIWYRLTKIDGLVLNDYKVEEMQVNLYAILKTKCEEWLYKKVQARIKGWPKGVKVKIDS